MPLELFRNLAGSYIFISIIFPTTDISYQRWLYYKRSRTFAGRITSWIYVYFDLHEVGGNRYKFNQPYSRICLIKGYDLSKSIESPLVDRVRFRVSYLLFTYKPRNKGDILLQNQHPLAKT